MDELRLAAGEIEAVVLPEIGARLHRLRAFGVDLLRTPEDVERHRSDPFFWGAYVMAPWCNRAPATPLQVAGRRVDLPANFPDGTAIHGLVYDRPWSVHEDGTLSVRSRGEDGWPWAFEVRSNVAVDPDGITLDYRLTNEAAESMPAGLGLHPWFRSPVSLTVDAAAVYPSNTDPSAGLVPVNGPFDLRTPGPMTPGLDATWTRFDDGPIRLTWPEHALRAEIRARVPVLHVAAASPPDLPAIAVEPQTHAPDGLRRLADARPGAMELLPPGAALDLRIRIDVLRAR